MIYGRMGGDIVSPPVVRGVQV